MQMQMQMKLVTTLLYLCSMPYYISQASPLLTLEAILGLRRRRRRRGENQDTPLDGVMDAVTYMFLDGTLSRKEEREGGGGN